MFHFTWMRAGKNHYGEVWLYGAVLALLLAWRWRRWRQRRLV
jgi:sulfoxide reductase heme-binding subunit YedZ